MHDNLKKSGQQSGIFVISLDFELFWGVRDKRSLESYGDAIRNVRAVVPRLLKVFDEYGIRATFATVGFLFARDKEELVRFSPVGKPSYTDPNLSPYLDGFLDVGENGGVDKYHFALDLIELIKASGVHEIGSHTFSHYYCLEDGQDMEDFRQDMESAISIATDKGTELRSLVFPRNQYNKAYRQVLSQYGIETYRGNERVWFHSYQSEGQTNLLKRVFRTANCYVNISGHHCYDLNDLASAEPPFDVPSSRFLRPFQAKYPFLSRLQLRRIKKSMEHASKNGLLYHLWWHPHNFGRNMDENFAILAEILEHYKMLHSKFGFESHTMDGVGDILKKTKG